MKLKIYLFLAVFFAAAFTANAQKIAGTYNGEMIVEVVVPEPGIVSFPNQDIIITSEGGSLVKLSILNFSFLGIELGNLEVAGISTANAGGTTTLSKAGLSNGPVIEELGGLGTLIKLNSANINAGALTLDLSVYLDALDMLPLEEAHVANVTFSGNNIILSGIFSPKAEKIAIYPTVATDAIVVEGFENADYSIFNRSGKLVAQGRLTTDAVNTSALNAGLYILNINESSAVFIKR